MINPKQQNDASPIRVLHVVTIMDRGGLETMLMNYYRNIDTSKIQFDFVVHRTKKGAYDDEIIKMGGKIYHMPPISLRNVFTYSKKLKALLIKNPEYQIVHSHLDSLSAFPLSIAKKVGIPTRIAHSHTTNFDKNYKASIRNVYKKFIKYYATDYFGCSKEAVEFMFGKNISSYYIMHNAIDVDKFKYNQKVRNKVRKNLNIPKDVLVVGHVGRFNYPKNHEFLIDIFYELHKKNKDSLLMLVGEGDLKQKIINKVDKLGLADSVIFLGSRPDVNELMQAMDIFVFPSRYEGLGIALIEAQAAGLKCLTTKDVIPSSVDITGKVNFIDLQLGHNIWANRVIIPGTTNNHNIEIINSNYSINKQVDMLTDYYWNMLNVLFNQKSSIKK